MLPPSWSNSVNLGWSLHTQWWSHKLPCWLWLRTPRSTCQALAHRKGIGFVKQSLYKLLPSATKLYKEKEDFRCGGTHLQSSGSRGSQTFENLSPAWSTWWVMGHPGMHSETLPPKKGGGKNWRREGEERMNKMKAGGQENHQSYGNSSSEREIPHVSVPHNSKLISSCLCKTFT